MELISSDSNIWFDFEYVSSLYVPFTLQDSYRYIISSDTLDAEITSPSDLKSRLLSLGLLPVETSDIEYALADTFTKYLDLSFFDKIALAIAKERRIILLTGDGHLRKAAMKECVEVHGTLWVVDKALCNNKISLETYKQLLKALSTQPKVRLPKAEIAKRLANINQD